MRNEAHLQRVFIRTRGNKENREQVLFIFDFSILEEFTTNCHLTNVWTQTLTPFTLTRQFGVIDSTLA